MTDEREPDISDSEIERALTEADHGVVSIKTEGPADWEEQYCGLMVFYLGNGFTVVVFNDCNFWDYIEYVVAPDGRVEERSLLLDKWTPKHPERWGKNCRVEGK